MPGTNYAIIYQSKRLQIGKGKYSFDNNQLLESEIFLINKIKMHYSILPEN